MLMRRVKAATAIAALLAAVSFSAAAENQPTHATEHHELTITHLVETAQTRADHEAVAKLYDEEAAQLDRKAADHRRLASHYHKGLGIHQKASSASLAKHCDNLVENYQASAADLREMANLHRAVGKALPK